MPDALSTLFNLQSPSNRTPGGGGGVPMRSTVPQTPLRNNARAASLARFLGIEDDGSISESDMEGAYGDIQAEQDADEAKKAQAAYAAETLKGEYGLEGARIKSRGDVESARLHQEAASSEHEASRAQQEYLTRLRGEISGEQQAATGARTDARATAAANARSGQMAQADKYRQGTELRKQAGQVNPLMNMITGRREQLLKQAQELTSQSDPVSVLADQIQSKAQLQGKSIEELMRILQPETAEEVDQLQQAYAMANGGTQ